MCSSNKSRDVKRVDDRRVINGIFYALRVGCPWRDLPDQYGPYTTVYNRFNRWSQAGIWDKIMMRLCAGSCWISYSRGSRFWRARPMMPTGSKT